MKRNFDGLVLAVSPGITPRQAGADKSRKAMPGTVGIGAQGEVVRLRGEVFGEEVRSGNYMGVSYLGVGVQETLPSLGCLVGDFALPILRGGGCIQTHLVETPFLDVGTPEGLLAANLNWLDAQAVGENPMGARLQGEVEVQRSVVGKAVEFLGRGLVRNCLILGGAKVRAPLEEAIVTPSGAILSVNP
ncbi:MAG: hypothetical protein MK135_07740 [Polyangiaceae bacterium]|nr:hypothetical protein [Polyangiaceae bacterium]